ncbi:hypothetical protein IQ07DRAFT_162726 [Pyrenochaeta sp. DS3sAY3a]|nr:hypothetical protein IQ07DRAFT_162726 [Pyrenochaeta sp. DS3sAY3a]
MDRTLAPNDPASPDPAAPDLENTLDTLMIALAAIQAFTTQALISTSIPVDADVAQYTRQSGEAINSYLAEAMASIATRFPRVLDNQVPLSPNNVQWTFGSRQLEQLTDVYRDAANCDPANVHAQSPFTFLANCPHSNQIYGSRISPVHPVMEGQTVEQTPQTLPNITNSTTGQKNRHSWNRSLNL